MKTILFCMNPYSFGILEPVMQVLKEKKYEYIWFVRTVILEKFPYQDQSHTTKIEDLVRFKSDAIFVPSKNNFKNLFLGVLIKKTHACLGPSLTH